MHRWGEEGVDWQGIDEAAFWLGKNLARYGRISIGQTKEKFGEVRVYCSFHSNLYTLIWPYERMFYPKLNKFQLWLDRITIPEFACKLIFKYQKFVYRLMYKKAIAKWPHLKEEILSGADWWEYLEGL